MFLNVKNLTKSYRKSKPIIKKLDFSITKGEIISFIGESGSGKTTFLKCLAGLESTDSGLIELNGRVLNDKNIFVNANERKIGFVFQDNPLFPHLNVIENIKFNLTSFNQSEFSQILKLTGLNGLEKRFPHELSGGEKQRACIARSLIRKPDLLLLDEPFSNLDSNIKTKIREETSRIIKESGITTIFVTHDIADTFNISDRILIFKAGVLQQFDEPVKMYCNPVNCYCAEVLGDLNQLNINNKTYYIRPENIYITKESRYKAKVLKSQFVGKEYKIGATVNDYSWHFFHNQPLKNDSDIYLDFNKKDLLEFDSSCSTFFTN